MGADVLVDSSGLYALADRKDPCHLEAARTVTEVLRRNRRLVLTDYVLDEAATLAKARGGGRAGNRLLDLVEQSAGFDFAWIGPDRFAAARTFFRKYSDHAYSFTDCTSFVVMRELKLSDALTSDRHFEEAGFNLLLPTA